MIRAVLTGVKSDATEAKKYRELVAMWKVSPSLSKKLAAEMEYSSDK